MAYEINYDDERFKQVESEKNAALTKNSTLYNDLISQAEDLYSQQIEDSKTAAEKQSQLQQERTDFEIEQIEQQKEQTQKDYIKEQSAAYTDWMKQSAKHGVEAEQIAAGGMWGSGYSESSQVSMYNTYQNRVATAKESLNKALLDYNNSITEARLQNNEILAEIAAEASAKQIELALQSLQYTATLRSEQADRELNLNSYYDSRWDSVLNQMNTENALAEQIRQYNESLALEKQQLAFEKTKYNDSKSSSTTTTSILKDDDGVITEGDVEAAQTYIISANGANLSRDFTGSLKSNGVSVRYNSNGTTTYTDSNSGYSTTLDSSINPYTGQNNATGTSDTAKAYKKYGCFSNGYQPKGIYLDGKKYGKVYDSGYTDVINGITQTVWKTKDGTLWMWDGSKNKYVEYQK